MYPSWFTRLLTGGIDLVHKVVLQRMRRRWWLCTGQGSGSFLFFSMWDSKGCEQKLWTFVRHSCKLSVCFFVVKKNNGTGSNGQIVGVHSWWHLCCWELIQQSSRMKPFVPACGIVKHWLGRVRAMTRLETITKPQPALLSFNDFARFFSNPRCDMLGMAPSQ